MGPPLLAGPEAFAARLPAGAVLAGGGAEAHAALLLRQQPSAALSARPPELAASVAELGLEALAEGRSGEPEGLRPVYLRAPAVLRG